MHAYQTPKTPQGPHFAGTSPKTPTLPSTLHSTLLQGEYQTSKHQNTQNGREGARMHTGAKSLSPRPSQLNFLRSKSSFPTAPALCQHIKHQKLTAPALCKHIPQNLHSKSSGNLSLKPHPRFDAVLWRCEAQRNQSKARSLALFAHGTFVIWIYPHHITGLYTSQLVQERNVTPWVVILVSLRVKRNSVSLRSQTGYIALLLIAFFSLQSEKVAAKEGVWLLMKVVGSKLEPKWLR